MTPKCVRCQGGITHEIVHGTNSGHDYHGCRCDRCKGWKAQKAAASYGRNREKILERQKEYQARTSEYQNLKAKDQRGRYKAIVQNPRRGTWTPGEDQIVLRSDLTLAERAVMIQREYQAVARRYHRLTSPDSQLKRQSSWQRWAERKQGEDMDAWRAKKSAQGRDYRTRMGAKVTDPKRGAWSADEDKVILQGGATTAEMAVTLNRSFSSVSARRQFLLDPEAQDKKKSQYRRYRDSLTPEELAVHRAKNSEQTRRYYARKKAEKLAVNIQENQ